MLLLKIFFAIDKLVPDLVPFFNDKNYFHDVIGEQLFLSVHKHTIRN